MTVEELQQFIDEQDALFRTVKDTGQSDRERVFARTVKIGEEYGELCDAVLSSVGDQREGKLAKEKTGQSRGRARGCAHRHLHARQSDGYRCSVGAGAENQKDI